MLAATVTVEVESVAGDAKDDGSSPERHVLAVASGTVVAPEGRIVVANLPHAENAEYYVRPAEGKRLTAKVLVRDRRSGLQLLQAEECDAPHLEITQQPAEIGQRVLAAVVYQGQPVRYIRPRQPHVLSTGIIAATGRRAEGFAVELLQTDIRAGAGSAGAPLCDEDGRLLGILVAADISQEDSDVSLAIPARYVGELLVAESGEKTVVIHPAYLGVQLEPLDEGDGAKIVQVIDDSPAAKGGIQNGDIVAALNGEEVQAPEDLTAQVGRLQAGSKVVLRLKRGDETPEVEVVLAERPQPAPVSVQFDQRLELAVPGQYRVVPLPQGAGSEALDPKSVESVAGLLQRAYAAHRQRQNKTEVRPEELTPLTVYVQRPEADQRLDKLTEEVKTLREEVKKLSEQLEVLSKKLDKPGALMTREEAIQSLREEFLKKLDDLVRQQDATKRP
jgi:S1-C subfamily serine protease